MEMYTVQYDGGKEKREKKMGEKEAKQKTENPSKSNSNFCSLCDCIQDCLFFICYRPGYRTEVRLHYLLPVLVLVEFRTNNK